MAKKALAVNTNPPTTRTQPDVCVVIAVNAAWQVQNNPMIANPVATSLESRSYEFGSGRRSIGILLLIIPRFESVVLHLQPTA